MMAMGTDMNEKFEPSDEMDLFISTLNEGDFGFKADTCMLQKTNKNYGEGKNCTAE